MANLDREARRGPTAAIVGKLRGRLADIGGVRPRHELAKLSAAALASENGLAWPSVEAAKQSLISLLDQGRLATEQTEQRWRLTLEKVPRPAAHGEVVMSLRKEISELRDLLAEAERERDEALQVQSSGGDLHFTLTLPVTLKMERRGA